MLSVVYSGLALKEMRLTTRASFGEWGYVGSRSVTLHPHSGYGLGGGGMEWHGSGGMEWHGGIQHRDTGLECLTTHVWAACGIPPICMVYLNPSWQSCCVQLPAAALALVYGLVWCAVLHWGKVGWLIDAEVLLCEQCCAGGCVFKPRVLRACGRGDCVGAARVRCVGFLNSFSAVVHPSA